MPRCGAVAGGQLGQQLGEVAGDRAAVGAQREAVNRELRNLAERYVLLGEACTLAALVGASLKFDGRLIMQAQGTLDAANANYL